jgi:hypothetical protein
MLELHTVSDLLTCLPILAPQTVQFSNHLLKDLKLLLSILDFQIKGRFIFYENKQPLQPVVNI